MGVKILFYKKHPAQIIAFALLICVASFIFLQNTQAAGGSTDIHLDLNIKEGLSNQAVFVGLGILLFVYALIITEVVHRTLAAALGGLLAMIALNYYTEESALSLKAVTTMIDWETIGLLLGMMVMVGIISHTGVFEWLAVKAYKSSGGEIWTLVVILCSVTAVLSAFLDNVTTMLLLTPVTIQLARVLGINPRPILISEVIFSNIGGAATMIGDPPNIMIGSGMSPDAMRSNGNPAVQLLADQGVTFNDFIIEMAPGIIMTIVPSFMLVRWLYKKEFSGGKNTDVTELENRYPIKDPKNLKISGSILSLVILGFFLHPVIHIAVSWVALSGAVLMLLATSRHDIEKSLEEVEWTTLLFFAGLFVLIHSLQYMGVIDYIGDFVRSAIEIFDVNYRLGAAVLIILWVSAIASAFIDNIPYTATMIPIVFTLAIDLDLALQPLIWALAFGACLGGNGTLIGASANVVTAGISEEAGYPISFNEFFRAGFPVMILTTFIVSFYMILVFVIGEASALMWKSTLVGVSIMGALIQYSRGRSKGKSPAAALIHDDTAEVVSKVVESIKEMKVVESIKEMITGEEE